MEGATGIRSAGRPQRGRFARFLDVIRQHRKQSARGNLPGNGEGRALRHVVEVRHASFCTQPFIYARIMGTREAEPLGYSKAKLDLWAERVRNWASGGRPDGLDYVAADAAEAPCDVYLYVISGDKLRNPQAAMALIDRLGR